MFHILVAVIVIATGEAGTFVSNQGYPSMTRCEEALPAAEQQFRDMLRVRNGLEGKDIKLQLICEFVTRKEEGRGV